MKKHTLKIGQSLNQDLLNWGVYCATMTFSFVPQKTGQAVHVFAGNWLTVNCTWHGWKGVFISVFRGFQA